MRIVWKDSTVDKKEVQYRGYWIEKYRGGWIVDIPGDNNVYRTNHCAKNAIDMTLGLDGRLRSKPAKRLERGIDIIGTKENKRLG